MCKSAYIHIPFCKSKCNYCSFVSGTNIDLADCYIKALSDEITAFYDGEILKTIYLGGGTPSVLPVKSIERILSMLKHNNSTEITIEINPDDANPKYLNKLKDIGINRLSFGVQTFNDKILKLIGRRHNAQTAINAIEQAKKIGFKNINIDLIYGLPEQSLNVLEQDFAIINTLNLVHISTYGLKIEAPSYFSKHIPENLPDDDTQADMYLFINQKLSESGYKRYEVSNFAKSGYESKHNLNYWNNEEYYGFGLAAHGYKNSIRYSNTADIKEYLSNPHEHKNNHTVTLQEKIEEEIFLGFRREGGIDFNNFKNKYGFNFNDRYKSILKKYTPEYLERTSYGCKLTLKGVMLSNLILSEFLN